MLVHKSKPYQSAAYVDYVLQATDTSTDGGGVQRSDPEVEDWTSMATGHHGFDWAII